MTPRTSPSFVPSSFIRSAAICFAWGVFALGASACESTSSSQADADVDALVINEPSACVWGEEAEPLPFPEGQVRTRLEGESRNRSTTCTLQTSAGGPEKVFRLRVAERRVVTIETVSQINTVVAIRTACDQPLTELACGASPGNEEPFPRTDAGFPLPPPVAADGSLLFASTNPADGSVERVLEPGVYFVIVDEEEPFGVGGDVLVKVSSRPLPPHAECARASQLGANTQILTESFDLASAAPPTCGPQTIERAYFYSVTIPSGHQLTARAASVGGDKPWEPVMQLHGTCDSTMCMASDMVATNAQFGIGARELTWVNNGPAPVTGLLSIGPDVAVSRARANVSISVRQPQTNGICQNAVPVADGTMLTRQQLVDGGRLPFACGFAGSTTLYYKATLFPQQRLLATVQPEAGAFFGLTTSLATSCTAGTCLSANNMAEQLHYTNELNEKQDVILAVSGFADASMLPTFSLKVTMPLPPAAVQVVTDGPLTTRETGTTATFRVRLASPPTSTVTLPLVSDKPNEVTVSPATLTFGPQDYYSLRTITVTGIDDTAADGHQTLPIHIGKAQSSDPRYAGLVGTDVTVTNLDNEPGLSSAGGPLRTAEKGKSAAFTVWLNAKPAAPVTFKVTSLVISEATVTPAELTFTPDNWDKPQTVTATGVADATMDGAQPFTIKVGDSTSTDPAWVNVPQLQVLGTNKEKVWENVAAKALPIAKGCASLSDGEKRIAADDAGNIFVALQCEATAPGAVTFNSIDGGVFFGRRQVYVMTSADGGQNFAAPVPLDIFDPEHMAIAAGRNGIVYLQSRVLGDNVFVHSKDHGRTWSAKRNIGTSQMAVADLAAVDNTVVVWKQENSTATWWRNDNGGDGAFEGPFTRTVEVGFRMMADPDRRRLWQVDGPSQLAGGAWKSDDQGKTFVPAVASLRADVTHYRVSVGGNQLWASPGFGVHRAALSGGNSRTTSVESTAITLLGLLADEDGGATMLESNFNLRARHFDRNGVEDRQPRVLASSAFGVTSALLEDGAVAYVNMVGSQPFFGLLVWDP